MRLVNKTRYRTADLRAIILGALAEAGLGAGGSDRVDVVYGQYSGWASGWAYKGKIRRWNGCARMRIGLPKPGGETPLDVKHIVWLVRLEVGHWRGLSHAQVATTLRYWYRAERRRRAGPVGEEWPTPEWAEGLTVAIEAPSVAEPADAADRERARQRHG